MLQLRRLAAFIPVTVMLCAMLAGCGEGLPYVIQLAEGQLGVQGNTEPISDVLASGRLDEEDAAKLELIVRARDFAADVIGLNAGDSYTQFYDTQGDPLAFNLSAARRDTLTPLTWTFPIVGEVPYLAFFDEDFLNRYEQELNDAGYDTMSYELDAYSTLGLFVDPVRSTMLRRSPLSLIETIIHELLHNTIYRTGDTVFNESLATFVGRQGAIDYLVDKYGADSDTPGIAREIYADTDRVNAFLADLYTELTAYYAQPVTKAEKIAGREAVFAAARQRFVDEVQPTLTYPESFASYASLPTNNAWMLANHRYNLNLDVFAAVYDATSGNWAATLAVFRAAANATGDPFEYLENWVAEQAGNP